MAIRDGWKILKPEEQLVRLVRDVARLRDQLRGYTRVQGIRLESRIVAGDRHLFAVVDDPTAGNDGTSYQFTP